MGMITAAWKARRLRRMAERSGTAEWLRQRRSLGSVLRLIASGPRWSAPADRGRGWIRAAAIPPRLDPGSVPGLTTSLGLRSGGYCFGTLEPSAWFEVEPAVVLFGPDDDIATQAKVHAGSACGVFECG